MESKLEYLKKYGFSNDGKADCTDDSDVKKKKKKKKSKVKDVGGLKIIDLAQPDFNTLGGSGVSTSKGKAVKNEPIIEDDDDDNEGFELQEELPQVAGIVDDSRLRTQFTTGGWQSAFRERDRDDIKREPLSEAEEELELPRRSRHDSDSPPVRRKRHDSSDEEEKINKKRGRRHDSDEDVSPPRRQRHDSDNSPPRVKNEPDSDISPPRKAEKSDSDASPPRLPYIKKEPGSDEENPPPARQHSRFSDISPPRIKKENDEDLSPPRKLSKTTLDGKKAGLQDAKSMREENIDRRKKEANALEGLSSEVSGRGAKTKVRGRLKNEAEEEKLKKERAEMVRKDMEAKYARWNKGVKQLEDQKAKINSDLHEMDKPLARDKDDQDRDAHLKAIERSEDPMLKYMQKKKKKTISGLPQYPEYKGPPPPPNRFGIRPGYRWDGVDRSTGFEKKLFESKNKRKAVAQEAHMWSVEDM